MNIVIEPECVDDIVAVRNVVRRASTTISPSLTWST